MGASICFSFKSKQYLLLGGYYSKFIEVDELKGLSTASEVQVLKTQFCRYGIWEALRCDNAPQLCSEQFKKFCKDFGIHYITSSPHHQQNNGAAERAIQTVKRMWKKAVDKNKAFQGYRSTPVAGLNTFPAQFLMGRRPPNLLLRILQLLRPKEHDPSQVRQQNQQQKTKKKVLPQSETWRQVSNRIETRIPVRMSPLTRTSKWLPATVVRRHE